MLKNKKFLTGFMLNLIIIFSFCWIFLNSKLIVYGAKQLTGQLRTLYYTENIEKALASNSYNKEEKEKLILIQKVKLFAEKELGFRETSNFQKVCDQKKAGLLWVLEASPAFEFKEYQWEFPFLGKVSYKGFFDKRFGMAEKKKLEKLGFDTELGRVSAWSTLGIFSDPILSENLKLKPGTLVNLIFHELFHSTYYGKNNVELNENLANFIAHQATLLFFKNDNLKLSTYRNTRKDDSLFKAAVLEEMKRLSVFYLKLDKSDTLESRRLKSMELEKSKSNILKSPFLDTNRIKKILGSIQSSGNCFFLGIKKYDGLNDSLDKLLKSRFKGDLKLMVKYYKEQDFN